MICVKTRRWGNIMYKEVDRMKKMNVFISIVALSFALAACGNANGNGDNRVMEENNQGMANGTSDQNDSTVTNEVDSGTGTSTEQNVNTSNQVDMQKKMDEIDYADFGLSVDYANHREYEAELEKNSDNSVEAEIDDTLNNVKKKGTDAFNELYPLVKQLTITQQTSKADALQEVMKVFNLPADYQEFEMEVRFKDGTKIEFEDRK